MFRRRNRQLFAVLVLLLCAQTLLSACQPPPEPPTSSEPPPYQFYNLLGQGNYSDKVSDTFTCLGITDAQIKSILKPGSYNYMLNPCRLDLGAFQTVVAFAIKGISDGPDSDPLPLWDSIYQPYLFYQYPTRLGDGGAWWQYPYCQGAMASPTSDAIPVVALDLPSSIINPTLTGRPGVGLRIDGDWRNNSPFTIDTISAMILLVQWAAYGITQQYPTNFIDTYPKVNTSSYLPPENGTLPTSTTTLPPIPSEYTTKPSPTATPSPTS